MAARGADCMLDLVARSVVQFASEELNNHQRAQTVVDTAHRCVCMFQQPALSAALLTRLARSAATARNWTDALEALLCLAATPALRRTGIGSSPALWHLLDNAKLSYERAALQRAGYVAQAAAEPDAPPGGAAAEAAEGAEDVWEQFERLAAQRALGERGAMADEL